MTATERRPITRQRSRWEPTVVDTIKITGAAWPMQWWQRRAGDGLLLASVAQEPGIGWHLAISFRDHRGEHTRYPTWDEIADARDTLLPAGLDFVMYLPRAGHYLAVHATTFHLHQHPSARDT